LAAANQIVKIIDSVNECIDVPALMKKTGYDEKKVRNIVDIAFEQSKVERAGPGGLC
jgi:hypothetical protein